MTNILIISEKWWPEGGGGELATYLITDMLSRHFKVTVITGSKLHKSLNGVRMFNTPLLISHSKHELWIKTTLLAKESWFKKLIKNTDIVYVPSFSFPVIPLAKRMGKKVIVHLHGYIPVSYTSLIPAPYEENKNSIWKFNIWLENRRGLANLLAAGLSLYIMPKIVRTWLEQADKVLCVSNRHAKIVSELAPELKNKIAVIHNPPPKDSLMINTNEISKEHKPTIAYNISDIIKGYHIFLKVLLRSSDNTRFITFGSAIPAIIKNRKKNILHYSRRLSHEEVIKIYMRSWGALFLSIVEETFGYAVLDAGLATAIPIAFKVGGISEIIEGTHAESFSVKPYDISSLLDKIEYISSMSPHQVMDIGIKIRSELLRKFDEKKIESSLIEIFNTILSE